MRALLLLALPLTACDALEGIDRLRCGNGLIEASANEDCDGLPSGSPYACGAPGGESACKLTCGEAAGDAPCPPGWACGGDGVCRAPSGHFDPPAVVRIEGRPLRLADVDGDGYTDLVGQDLGAIQVAYGSAQGFNAAPQITLTPSPQLNIAVGDATGDERADVMMITEEGALLLTGAPDRTLTPQITPRRTLSGLPRVVASIRARPPFTVSESLLLVGAGSDDNQIGDSALDVSGLVEPLGWTGTTLSNLGIGDLDGDGGAPGAEELIYSVGSESAVAVIGFECPEAGPCDAQVRQILRLPQGARMSRNGPQLGDIDGDGDLDLLLGANQRMTGLTLVAINDGGFLGPLEAHEQLTALCDRCTAQQFGPQAVADLNGDGIIDVVQGTELALGLGGEPAVFEPFYTLNRPLQSAQTADLNNDGIDDLYGTYPGGLLFLLGHPEGILNQITPRAPQGSAMMHGDYDGDGRTDLAIVQVTGDVNVLYGTAEGLPELEIFIGYLGDLFNASVQLTAAQRAPLDADRPLDLADELVLIQDAERYVFAGSTARLPQIPTVLPGEPQGVAVGTFGGDPGALMFLLGPEEDTITLPIFVSGEDLVVTDVDRGDCGAFITSPSAETRVMDLDGDGEPEILMFNHRDPASPQDTQSQVQVFHLEGDTLVCLYESARAGGGQIATAYALGDFDGDGQRSLAALYSPINNTRAEDPRTTLSIWPVEDGGGLGEPTLIDLPSGGGLTSLSIGDAAPLFIAHEGSIRRLRPEADPAIGEPLLPVSGVVSDLQSADFNLDGVEDLLIRVEDTAYVHLQRPCGALEAFTGTCTRPAPW